MCCMNKSGRRNNKSNYYKKKRKFFKNKAAREQLEVRDDERTARKIIRGLTLTPCTWDELKGRTEAAYRLERASTGAMAAYARHELSNYDNLVRKFSEAKVEKYAPLLKIAALEAVSEAWPALARQVEWEIGELKETTRYRVLLSALQAL